MALPESYSPAGALFQHSCARAHMQRSTSSIGCPFAGAPPLTQSQPSPLGWRSRWRRRLESNTSAARFESELLRAGLLHLLSSLSELLSQNLDLHSVRHWCKFSCHTKLAAPKLILTLSHSLRRLTMPKLSRIHSYTYTFQSGLTCKFFSRDISRRSSYV